MSSSAPAAAQVFRLSPQQRRLWSLAPGGEGPYRALARVRIEGRLDRRALETALVEVAVRHEILRTTFPMPAGMSVPGQAVHDEPVPTRLDLRDLSGLPGEERELAPGRIWEELAARPFHPDREPPILAVLAELAPESHVLLLAVHALCADEAALGVLVHDLRRAYAGEADELPVQYADVAAALEELLESEESEAGRAWWREILPAVPAAERLPFEREAGSAPFEPRLVETRLAPGLAARPAVFLAAWQALLARLAPETEVTGFELAGRHYEGFETALGPFARCVPLRTAVRAGEPFAKLVARLEEQVAALSDWQDYFSWERVTGDEAGFFSVVFCWKDGKDHKDSKDNKDDKDGFRLERVWACTDRFRLRLTVRGTVAELAYDAARFRERDVRTLLASWLALLESAPAAPDTPVGDLDLGGVVEREAAERPFEPVPVQELFFAQARRTPDAVALSTVPAGESVTYAELAHRASMLAAHLQSLGVGPEVPVALSVERSVEMVVGVLGILAAGGAYVPLDPSYPQARRDAVLEASGAPVVLTREGPEWSKAKTSSLTLPGVRASAAYILFTSGSTGTPKGVVVSHRALTNHMLWMQEAYPLAPGDRVLQKTPLGFDASVWEVFAPLLAGAELVLAEPDAHRDPARLAWATAESGATVLQVVPSLLRPLLGEEAFAACTSLRRLFCGGEPLSEELRDRVHALLPGADLINLYGPTETTVQVASWVAERGVASTPGATVPIGRPIHNARIHVLDAGLRPVPFGLPGELWIGGEPVARGYLGRPDLTAASFLPDPFATEPGARLYRTGDLGRSRDDGALEFLGRAGREVKIRGYRFDPGEIEDLLGREDAVREAAVVVLGDRLVAYVVPRGGRIVDPAVLRARLAEHLPDFLVPSVFVPLAALPRTASGKLDRSALPEPSEAAAESSGFVAPRTTIEEVLAEIWADLLGRGRVGVHDDFFALGGHSLLGAQLVARVRQALGVEISLRTIFETPTVAGLAEQVAVAWALPEEPPITRVPRDREIPLSFAQQRLWFLDRLAPDSPVYNVFTAALFTGSLDERALLGAFREIVRVQEALRTTFPAVDGRPVQRPAPALALDLPVADLAALPPEMRLPEAQRLAGEEARRPFDLARGPLLRLALLRLGDGRNVLFTGLHHIVSDAWSVAILYRDLMALYAGARSLPEPPVQYADYAVWQRSWFEQVREGELAWWREQLADLPTLRLPTDRRRPRQPTFRGTALPVSMSPEISEPLRRLARSESVTPFMLLLAAFQALLHRWSGQDEVVVGAPVANRERTEIEDLVGFFVNTLVLRTSLAGDPTVRKLLARVREVALGAYAHQAVPFEVLVEELAPERGLNRQPLFQVMFQLQTVPVPHFKLPGVEVGVLDVDPGTAPFDLGLDLREMPEGVIGELRASAELFDQATVGRLLEHLRTLLTAAVADPGLRLSELPLLTGAERHQIAVEWNDNAIPYETDRCIHELFAEQAARTPDAEALDFADGRLTYAELEARSNQLARQLLLQGAGPETRVATNLASSAELFVCLLAILKTGAAYVPLDPAAPESRAELLLEEAGAALLIKGGGLFTPLPGRVCGGAGEGPGVRAHPESLAYVLFTSGSTGRPKGVAVPHRAIVRLVRGTASLPVGPGDRVAQVSNIAFDSMTFEVWGALLNGGCLVGLPRDVLLAPRELAGWLRRERITTFLSPTALLHQIAREEPSAFQAVRHVTGGGEALDPRRAREILAAGPPCHLVNVYGPTEATCFVTWEPVVEVPDEARTVPLGRPIGNTLLLVLDRSLRPVPIGIHGELCLGGEALARGYLGQPALTAERFVPDPVGGFGTRLYRTGDRARLLPDGRVDFLGRLDDQVKVRGFRIEPGEIETALAGFPGLTDSVVLPREEEEGRRRLVAYVVPESLDPGALRSFLRERLPEFMVPSIFVPLAGLPLTPIGKVDRSALARIRLRPGSGAGEGNRPPHGAVEESIAAVWAEVLEAERIGARDRFFDLGGHSLLALRVLSRMRDVLGLEVPLRVLFEAPTIEGLAAWIEAERGQALVEAPPIALEPRDRPLPLSFTQERLWLVDCLFPGTPLYNVPTAARLRGPLVPAALASALTGIVQRHEALRTRYATTEEGAPVQLVDPAADVPFPCADLSALPGERRLAEAGRLAWEESIRPFDLKRGPVLRALLLWLGEADHVAVLTRHHIVFDGWSQHLFLREIGVLYEAFASGRPSPLPPLPVQYADFAVWQRRHLRDDVLASQLAWWRDRLAGAPAVLELPTDRPRPPVQSFEGEIRAATWDIPFVDTLRALARHEAGTLNLILLAAFEVLVARLTGGEDIVLGSPVANRPRPELEGLIGFFANTIVLRTDLAGDPPFREVVARVRETSLGAWEHQDLPFERLVEELRPRRDPSHTPVFQVMFIHQAGLSAEVPAIELPGFHTEPFGGTRTVSRYDLEVYAVESSKGLTLALEYSTALFDAERMVRLLGQMETVLRGAVGDPGLRLSELPLLSPAEQAQLLAGWTTVEPAEQRELLHELFEAQVARTPEALALIAGHERWTYRELEERAEAIAADLRVRGVGMEERVAVSLPRTAEMVATMLGILKAGGVYVPVDPEYPAGRRERILADAQKGLSPPLPGGRECVWERGPGGEGHSGGRLAYLIYTSGSTGDPKGVAVPHAAAVALVRWAGTVFSREDLAGVLASTSINFDLSVFEIFVPLAYGGTVILAENALELPRLPAAGAVTLINTVPSAMAELVRMEGVPAGVRVVNLAGEALARELADRVLALPQVERLYNLYGPSEDTTYSTFTEVRRGERRAPSIGQAIAGTRAVVVDRWLRPAPVGVPGELCLAGAGLARGYLGRPAETAEKWVPEPFSEAHGARMYRTGDLVRRRADGELEFLGRIDHQLKVRGFRVEPGEIEAALRTFPGVEEAVVSAWQGRLVAWVAGPDPGSLSPAGLRQLLRERLPEPLVPSFFVALTELPRTSTGKIDRAALPAPEAAPTEEGGSEAGGPIEELVAGVWAEVLGVERVGLRDDFFDLGGHSLLATRLVARLRALLGVEMPVRAVFEAPTVASFSRAVLAAERGVSAPLVRRTEDGDQPLSFAQERMWFLELLEPGAAYHIPLAVRLTGALDAGALESALNAIIRRHEALRTSFPSVDGLPVQRIAADGALSLPRIDLSGLSSTTREAELARLGTGLAGAPFDLESGPLLRALLLKTGAISPGEHVLLATLHHIVSDGWSIGLLVRELATFYSALREGTRPVLPELPVQYADWAVWQREQLESGTLDAGLAWWRSHLGSEPAVLEIHGDRPRPAVPSFRGAEHGEVLPADLLDPVRSLARRSGTSLFMTLLALWQVFLARHTGQDDFVVGTPVAGRDRAEVEGLIGLFVNTLALRARVPAEESFSSLLAHVREATLGAFAHAWVPFERVVEAVQPRRDLGHSPLFQTMLALQNTPQPAFSLPDLALASVDVEVRTSPFDLTLALSAADGGLLTSWIWALDLFDASTVARFAGRFRTLVAAVVAEGAEPERPVADLPLLPAAERHALLYGWNDSGMPLPAEPCIHRIFAAHVQNQPEAVAVEESDGESLTYAALDRRARRLARRLRSFGVRPDVPVGICAGRALDLVVGMLATLQAGGVCLPLDPEYPRERLDLLLQDARPAAVLVQSHLASRLPEAGVPVLLLDGPDKDAEPGLFEPPPVLGHHLACIFHTSGSTGRPKGVGVTHRGVCRLILDPRWEIGPTDRVAQLSSPSFDAATLEIWGALLRGARLVGFRREEVLAPADLAAAIRRHGLTMLVIPPSWFHRVAAELPDAFAPVRIMSIGGEAGDPTAFARVLAAGPPQWLFHSYGPTEVTTLTTVQPVRTVAAGLPILPAGRPLAEVRIRVLDEHLRLLPQGVPGELFAGGDRLARGYLSRPDLTAERFVPDPFGPPGGRLYATGDLARVLPGGEVQILGRRDRQVKIRGFRIEPGEIEAALAEHPAVAQTAVVVREEAGEKKLAAFVVPREVADPAEMRAFLAGRLPAFMVPASLIVLPELPLTPNGKVDREALARLDVGGAVRTPGSAPRTLAEELLAAIWADLLRVERPGPDDSFFALGGHSLLAAKLMARIREAFGIDLPLLAVFEAPTLAGMAARIEDLARSREAAQSSHSSNTHWSPLVRLTEGRAGESPLFCVHGAAGTVAVFADLARLLQEERPVYALQARGLAEGQTPLDRIEDMAALYVAAVREARPHGPYRLLGYSMGAQVAFEMARRLAADGETVDLLALIDFPALAPDKSDEPLPEPQVPDLPGLDREMVRRHLAVWRANRDAAPPFTPLSYSGKALLVLAEEGYGAAAAVDPTLGWGQVVAGGVTVARVPGDHFTVLTRPHADAVALTFKETQS